MKDITPVILCGGAGARLWPMSDVKCPKQFQSFDGTNPLSFFQRTVMRHLGAGFTEPMIVTGRQYEALIQSQLRTIGRNAGIVLEPAARSTGPAVLATALLLAEDDPDALMLVLPSDHVIHGDFNASILDARCAARSGQIVTFGVKARHAETGYGYILDAGCAEQTKGLHRVGGFVEKPNSYRAAELLASGKAFWSTGISMFSARTLISEFRRLAPKTFSAVSEAVAQARRYSRHVELSSQFANAVAEPTEKLIFETSQRLALCPIDVDWSDVGSWQSLYEMAEKDDTGNVLDGPVITEDVSNCLIKSDGRRVSALGVRNLTVVCSGDEIMIADQKRSQEVRKLARHVNRTKSVTVPPETDPLQEFLALSGDGDLHLSKKTIPPQASQVLQRKDLSKLLVLNGKIALQEGSDERILHQQDVVQFSSGEVLVTNLEDYSVEVFLFASAGEKQTFKPLQEISTEKRQVAQA